ncbi:hypothetical protein [Natronoglycomyces albus]|uniref:Uncharacterized protein n=1 Tax=Natronoglycomyces albus TaxID=2811108 RepID=A0A895XGW0_9ACTN|nr:hypothetical protein [Natronoglycomyces albus]QSB04137.1 hypothetical protein JQS30_09960 [Natronoglycomyces albus]
MHIGQPLLRFLRAGIFAAVCVTVSAGLHRLAGGESISWLGYTAAALFIGAGAYVLAGRQRGITTILSACLTSQVLLHILFTLGADPAGAGTHTHHQPMAMVLLHAAAAGVSAVWLARGDAALAAFFDYLLLWLAPALIAFMAAAIPLVTSLVVRAKAECPRRSQLTGLALVAPRRGPPACVLI